MIFLKVIVKNWTIACNIFDEINSMHVDIKYNYVCDTNYARNLPLDFPFS